MGRYEGIKTKIIIPKSTDELGQGQAVGLGLVAVADSILMFAKAHLLIRGSLKKDELNAGVVQWLEDFDRRI